MHISILELLLKLGNLTLLFVHDEHLWIYVLRGDVGDLRSLARIVKRAEVLFEVFVGRGETGDLTDKNQSSLDYGTIMDMEKSIKHKLSQRSLIEYILTMRVYEFPPRLCLSKQVSFDSLYGTTFDYPFLPPDWLSVSAVITFLSTWRDLLISILSLAY